MRMAQLILCLVVTTLHTGCFLEGYLPGSAVRKAPAVCLTTLTGVDLPPAGVFWVEDGALDPPWVSDLLGQEDIGGGGSPGDALPDALTPCLLEHVLQVLAGVALL